MTALQTGFGNQGDHVSVSISSACKMNGKITHLGLFKENAQNHTFEIGGI